MTGCTSKPAMVPRKRVTSGVITTLMPIEINPMVPKNMDKKAVRASISV
jgi:hypothetical protein